MFVNFFIIVMMAMFVGLIMNKIKLPSLLGMLILGIIIGPHGINLIDSTIMQISPELRKMALIIILLMGMMHPPPLNDNTELDIKRKILFFIPLAILILCYIPFPFRTL